MINKKWFHVFVWRIYSILKSCRRWSLAMSCTTGKLLIRFVFGFRISWWKCCSATVYSSATIFVKLNDCIVYCYCRTRSTRVNIIVYTILLCISGPYFTVYRRKKRRNSSVSNSSNNFCMSWYMLDDRYVLVDVTDVRVCMLQCFFRAATEFLSWACRLSK